MGRDGVIPGRHPCGDTPILTDPRREVRDFTRSENLDVNKRLSGVDDLAQHLSIAKARVEPHLDKAQIEFLDRRVFGNKFHGLSIGKELGEGGWSLTDRARRRGG